MVAVMRRTFLPLLVLLALVTTLSASAQAHHKAKHKHGPKPPQATQPAPPTVIRGSYELTLRPDPCGHTSNVVWVACFAATNGRVGPVPESRHSREFRFASPGTFRATLTPERTLQSAVPEWDLVVWSGGAHRQRAQQRAGSYELTYAVGQAYEPFRLWAQNRSGWLDARVTWSFTYR